jgi:hypothetical protein
MRKNNIEFRKSGVRDSKGYIPENRDPELIEWEYDETNKKEYCFTLCWFKKDNEGYYMETIGDRFFNSTEPEVVMLMGKYALKILNAEFDVENG